jgi:hypothetical protein
MNNEIKFKVGDKLEALDYDKEEYGLKYVTITSINEEKKVYHWEASNNLFDISGKLSSGYFFHEAKEYKESPGSYTCPVTKEQCDDECCTSPENCNIQAGIGISDCEPESESLSYEDAFERDVCIHFAKWIAPSWMGIWVEDKWLWECLDEDMPKEHMGYKTDEELYELYLKSI